ncbi:MAG: UDP-N-acetylglucosamine 2-epimerase (hydrolyzing) [Gammaproteobacteria bacterium]|nr:MAG: UDP-N-acetylglucosamine 2-epimerase (hydrolyzing) [Gammaproteobacteria bacterium]
MKQERRKICYLSGTRADFGLVKVTLDAIVKSEFLSLDLLVTGMHLSDQFGNTVNEIKEAGFNIAKCIPVDIEVTTGSSMAKNIAKTLEGCISALEQIKPDILILLGDRGEMLAGAIAAIHLNIPIVHIHGGERSGTVDEPVRHAISKLSHYHFVSTLEARERLVRMGEPEGNVFVTGAPGLDNLDSLITFDRNSLFQELDLDINKPVALMVFHPVLQEANIAGDATIRILNVLIEKNVQVVALKPNSDAGSHNIKKVLEDFESRNLIRVVTHFSREKFVSWMSIADLMIGNSSAGIIEAASLGTPVINIGVRQNLRERNKNIIDVGLESADIDKAINVALTSGRFKIGNIYGDGNTAEKIVVLLNKLSLDSKVLYKINAY